MAVAERLRFAQVLRSTLLAVATVCLAVFAEPCPSLATPLTSAANIPFSGISPGGVDMATGELILVCRPDLYLDAPFPLEFHRYYASMLAREGLASSHLGPNWLDTYDWSLSVVGSNATLVTNEGAAIRFTQAPAGGWNLTSPTYAKFKLDLISGAWRVTNPVDRRVYFFDGTTWLLTSIQDEHGNTLALTYTGGRLSQVADGLGRALNFSYDALGNLGQVTDGTRSVHFSYTGGTLTGVTDAGTHSWSYAYAPGAIGALLTGVTEPLGNTPITQFFDPSGRVMSQMDALGGNANYQYDTPSGNFFTDPLANAWTYQHDSGGRLTTLTDPMGGPHSYGYDALGRLQSVSRPLGDATSFQYDAASGYPSDVMFGDGSTSHWTYGSHLVSGATLFDRATALFADGSSESYTRDANGNVTDLMDRGGFHWTGTYNARGQLLTELNPTNGATTLTYDAQGRLSSRQDNAGNVTGFSYDPLGRLTQVTWPDLTHRNFGYDPLDALISMTDERGKVWGYGYDTNERLTSETDPLLNGTAFGYDNMDRVTQSTDPLGHAAHYAYDPTGRLLTSTDRSGRVTSYQYDTRNLLTGIQDPAGGTDGFSYDSDGRVLTEHDPLGNSSTFAYDFMDRVTHLTDRVGSNFDYVYDAMGRLTSATGPLGYHHTYGYDARGLLTSFHNATSETDYPRTPLGEISRVVDPNRNEWPRNYDPQGRITSSADPLNRGTSYQYDPLSRVIHVGRPDGTAQQIQYDAAGRLTGQSFTDGTTLTYGYDDANRMTSATGASFGYDAAGRMTNSNGFDVTYDQDGRPLSETFAPGKTANYSYENRGLLSQMTDWMGGLTSFTYDTARRLTGINRPNGTTGTYAYDGANRLTSAVENLSGQVPRTLSSISITRDGLGRPSNINRRVPLMPGATSSSMNNLTYDAASQFNGATHDPLGRMTSEGSRAFQWDGASRLVHLVTATDTTQFTTDAFGQVKGWNSGSSTVAQGWSYAWTHPDYDDTYVSPLHQLTLSLRTPSGLLLYRMDGSSGSRTFYHYDEAGNTAYLTNDDGSVTTEYAYGPYGGVKSIGETANNPFTFGAAGGQVQLGSGGGLWTDGPGVYDERTLRDISGLVTSSGRGGKSPGPIGRDPGPSGSPGSFVELNPQPLPPGGLVGRAPGPVGDPGSFVELNPQPFPPGTFVGRNPGPSGDPGSFVELNPQPLPPGGMVGRAPGPQGDPGSFVELNPQPLPPGGMSPMMAGTTGPGLEVELAILNPESYPPDPCRTFPPDPCFPPSPCRAFPPSPCRFYPPSPCAFVALLKNVPVKAHNDFGMVKSDGNSIGNGEFGGGYDYSLGSRLMEDEGISHFFNHEDGAHTLVPGSPGAAAEGGQGFYDEWDFHHYLTPSSSRPSARSHRPVLQSLEADPFDDSWQLHDVPKNAFFAGGSSCAWCP